MANGFNSMGVGALFNGILQGIQQGKQRQADFQHKKDLLKLEQDKLKLIERAQDLTSGSNRGKLLMDMMRLNQENEQAQSTEGRKIVTVGPGQTAIPQGSIPSTGFSVPATPSKIDIPARIQETDYIVRAAAKRGIKLNPDEVMMKLSQGGAGMSFADRAELVLLPWELLGKSKEVQALMEEIRTREGGSTTPAKPFTPIGKKDDWRNYLPGSTK